MLGLANLSTNSPDDKKNLVVNPNKLYRDITKSWSAHKNPKLFKVKSKEQNHNIPMLSVNFNDKLNMNALVDTGASYNIMNNELYNELIKNKLIPKKVFNKEKISLLAANNIEIPIQNKCVVKIKVDNNSWKTEFLVTELQCCKLILGTVYNQE